MFYVSKQRTMLSDIISNNVEALVSGDDHPGYDIHDLHASVEDGDINRYCGELTTGDPDFTICQNMAKTTKEWKIGTCYTKKK